MELDGEILERIVEGCEDKEDHEDHEEFNPSVTHESKEMVIRRSKNLGVNPVASSTMIESDSCDQDSGCSCTSVYTWTIHEDEDDHILEDSYMKDVELFLYEDDAPKPYSQKFQRTSTKSELSSVNAQEVPNSCNHEKVSTDKKETAKKPMMILKNLLRLKKSKESGEDGKSSSFNKKNILKKMKRFNDDQKQSELQTLAMV